MYFIDTVLPFGLRSSPGIFNQFADLVCWIMHFVFALQQLVHYSDDFLLVSCTEPGLANKDLAQLCAAFEELHIPLATDKVLGPACCMTYLGIEINSVEQTIAIPHEKYTELMELLPKWFIKRTCTKQQLLSLVGKLSFVCKVVRPGRIFLRWFINLSMTVRELHHHITLTKPIQEDIQVVRLSPQLE